MAQLQVFARQQRSRELDSQRMPPPPSRQPLVAGRGALAGVELSSGMFQAGPSAFSYPNPTIRQPMQANGVGIANSEPSRGLALSAASSAEPLTGMFANPTISQQLSQGTGLVASPTPELTRVIKLTGFNEQPPFSDILNAIKNGKVYSISYDGPGGVKMVFIHRHAAQRLLREGWLKMTDEAVYDLQVEPMANEDIGTISMDASRVLIVNRMAPRDTDEDDTTTDFRKEGWNELLINGSHTVTLQNLTHAGVLTLNELRSDDIKFLNILNRLHKMEKIRREHVEGSSWVHMQFHYLSVADAIADKEALKEDCAGDQKFGVNGPVINPKFGLDPCAEDLEEAEADSEYGRPIPAPPPAHRNHMADPRSLRRDGRSRRGTEPGKPDNDLFPFEQGDLSNVS